MKKQEHQELIDRILKNWDGQYPAQGDIDPQTGLCRCGCGKGPGTKQSKPG